MDEQQLRHNVQGIRLRADPTVSSVNTSTGTASTTIKDEFQDDEVQLKRTLNLGNGISIIIGVIIGSGIFISPQGVLLESGSPGASLCVWILCGLLSLLGALCFAELGTSIESSGGEYTYIRLAYGPLASFLYLWVTVTIIMPCGNAITALTFANYVLQPFYIDCLPPQMAIRLLAIALLLLLVYINCASVSYSIKLQNSFTMAKIIALILIITFGFYYILTGRSSSSGNRNNDTSINSDQSSMRKLTALDDENQSSTVSSESSMVWWWYGTQTSVPHLAQAFYAGFYTYSGWNALNCVTEELKDPIKTMPKAIMLSITSIIFIYTLTNISYFAVLTRDEILNSSAIAVIFGERITETFKAYTAIRGDSNQQGHVNYIALLLSSSTKWIMPITVALSTIGGLNGGIFAQSRVLFAGSRQGQLFSTLSMLNVYQLTPMPSLIFLGFLTSLYMITTQILTLINYMVFVDAIFAALSVSTVLKLRFKYPNLKRPLRIPTFVPILYLLFSLLLITLPIITSPIEATMGIVILLSGLPVYYLTARWKEKPAAYQRAIDKFNKVTQKLTLSVTPEGEVSSQITNSL